MRKFAALVADAAVLNPESGGSCEWLYGWGGTLYLLGLMRAFVPACAEVTIAELVEVVMDIGDREGGWEWYGKKVSGGCAWDDWGCDAGRVGL